MSSVEAERLADIAVSAYQDHARIVCNLARRDRPACTCICGEPLAECRPAVHAEHRRAHIAAALAVATAYLST